MSLVSGRRPLPVSIIAIVVGVMRYVKAACVVGFCTGLKSRLIAWCGDIGQCTQMSGYRPFFRFADVPHRPEFVPEWVAFKLETDTPAPWVSSSAGRVRIH